MAQLCSGLSWPRLAAMIRLIATTAICCVIAIAGQAGVTDYECALKERGESGWIAGQLILQHDAARGKVVVVDPVILSLEPEPVVGKLVKETGAQITFGWEVKSPRDRNGTVAPSMLYQITVVKASGTATIQARPTGFPEVFTGKGKCKITGG